MRGTAGGGNQVVVEGPHKRRARDLPKPFRMKRRRALSSTQFSAKHGRDWPLACLLREIRNQIWLSVLDCSGRQYHLMHGDGSIPHALCQSGSHNNLNSIINPCCSSSQCPCCPETILPYTCFNKGRGRVVMGIYKPWHKLLRVDLTLLCA